MWLLFRSIKGGSRSYTWDEPSVQTVGRISWVDLIMPNSLDLPCTECSLWLITGRLRHRCFRYISLTEHKRPKQRKREQRQRAELKGDLPSAESKSKLEQSSPASPWGDSETKGKVFLQCWGQTAYKPWKTFLFALSQNVTNFLCSCPSLEAR